MSKKLITAARAYRVALPAAAILATHLEPFQHADLKPSEAAGAGFVPVEPSEDLVHPLANGYAFALQMDSKIVPGSVVKAELKAWANSFEQQNGHKPGRKQMREAKEQIVIPGLLSRALVRSKVVRCFYHTGKGILIVPSAGKAAADAVMGLLVRAVESIKSTTIHVAGAKGSLTARLVGHLDTTSGLDSTFANTFDPFDLGAQVKLQDGEGRKYSFDLDQIEDAEKGIREAINGGALVTEIALAHNGVGFRLTQDFILKGIKFEDGSIEYDEEPADKLYTFDMEAAAQLTLVTSVIDELCTLFDYKAPEEKAEGLL